MATVTIMQNYRSEYQRTGITAPDADASALPPWSIAAGKGVRFGATCGQPNANLALRLYFLDSGGRIVSVASISFSTSQPADWGATYTGTPSGESWWPVLGAQNLVVKADQVSPGSTWNIAGAWGE